MTAHGRAEPLVLGIDIGTTGVRAVALDTSGDVVVDARCRFDDLDVARHDPSGWWDAVQCCLRTLAEAGATARIVALGVDGTSGTLLPIDAGGEPLAPPSMYDDPVDDEALLHRVYEAMPRGSAAGGATSGLAKALRFGKTAPWRVVHQADWIAGRLTGVHGETDANNALKTGCDPERSVWPAWVDATGIDRAILPTIRVPGEPLRPLAASVAQRFGFPSRAMLHAGTTDGCASFLATGAERAGDSVTALGSTLVLKMLSRAPLFDPSVGLYSHRVGGSWLAGGASNSGGRVLAHYFDTPTLERLSAEIDPESDSGLDYYPLIEAGERFPVNDPALAPRVEPRPADDVRFLHGLLDGMAMIEARAYARLAELGAPSLQRVFTVGGGARNTAWRRIRERRLGVPVVEPQSTEAAVGVARLVLRRVRPQASPR